MIQGSVTEIDKLLICLVLILVLTIVWALLIGIMCKMTERKPKKINTIIELDDENKQKVTKKRKKPKRKTAVLETYVKIRFNEDDKKLIFVAPKNIELVKGQEIKVQVDKDTVQTAKVAKGNYIREKYKTNYSVLKIAKE